MLIIVWRFGALCFTSPGNKVKKKNIVGLEVCLLAFFLFVCLFCLWFDDIDILVYRSENCAISSILDDTTKWPCIFAALTGQTAIKD